MAKTERKNYNRKCPRCKQNSLIHTNAGEYKFKHKGKTHHQSWKEDYWCHECNKIFKPEEVRKTAKKEKDKKKSVFKEEIKCPHCQKRIEIEKIKTLTNNPTPAEYDEKIIVRKSVQTKLKE